VSTRVEAVLVALGLEIADRRGGRAWLTCPFHEQRSAGTFFVRLTGERAGQNWCFSCKAGGSLRALVMHVKRCSEAAAKEFVAAAEAGFEKPKLRARVVARPAVLGRTRYKLPPEIIYEPLKDWLGPAQDYARGRCRITDEEVALFGLGHAVDGRLACRIVLPWLGAGRRPGGYSARTYIDAEPKYLTPPESEGADRATMFGEHLWPPLGQRPVVAVTEGALNALAVRRAREMPVAALGGSEIDPLQVTKLATFARVLLVTDPDPAGNKAARQLERALARHVEVVRAAVPMGKDALDVEREQGTGAVGALLDATSAP
jgi:DNA primase